MFNRRRWAHIVKKEFIQLRRDRAMLRMLFIAPVLQLLLLSYAATTDVKHIPTVVCDQDHSRASREFVARFANSGYFDLDWFVDDPRQIGHLLDRGQAQVALHLPPTFARDLARQRPTPVQIIIDGTDSNTAGVASGYVNGIIARYAQEVLRDRAARMLSQLSRLPEVEAEVRVWYNPDLKSINYMVPAVICMILMVVTMIFTAVAVVREREIGTLEQLLVTPIRPTELMLGKAVPFVVIGLFDVLLIVFVARFLLGVPMVGSLLLLFGLTFLFLMTTLGLGLFISSISRTQQEAMMTNIFVMLPSIILSGFFFPIENMPRVIQYLTYLIPARYFITIIRGIFLKGSGLGVLWPQALALAALGVVLFLFGAYRFRRKLD